MRCRDSATLNRTQVARELGLSVDQVRRREERDLHPKKDAKGILRFDKIIVAEYKQKLADEASGALAPLAPEGLDAAEVEEAFVRHAAHPWRASLEGLALHFKSDITTIRKLHTKWATPRREAGLPVPKLLTRDELRAASDKREKAADREHRTRMKALEDSMVTRLRAVELGVSPNAAARARRRSERQERLAAIRTRM